MLVVATYDRRVTSGGLVGILESGVRAAESTLEDIWNRVGVAGFKVKTGRECNDSVVTQSRYYRIFGNTTAFNSNSETYLFLFLRLTGDVRLDDGLY
jgi:hypothetical protein